MTITQYETTNTLPDVFQTPAQHDTDSWVQVMAHVVKLAQEVATTDFVPRGLRGNVPATAAAMLYGREVGLPPMTALTSIHVIEGRPGMAAEGMRSLVFAAGHELVFAEATGAVCTMRARRRASQQWTELTWTTDMARAAGLLGKDNWKKYPRAMLIARCTTDLCRMVFPDVIHGFRSTEEIQDMGAAEPEPEAPAAPARKRTVRRRPVPDPDPAGPPYEQHQYDAPPIPDAAPGKEVRPGPGAAPAPEETATPPSGAGTQQPASPTAPSTGVDTPTDEGEAGARTSTRPQVRMLHSQMGRLGLADDREERMLLIEAIVGHPVKSTNDLTFDEAQQAITTASSVRTADELRALVAATEAKTAAAHQDDAAGPGQPPTAADEPVVEDPPEDLFPVPEQQGRDRA